MFKLVGVLFFCCVMPLMVCMEYKPSPQAICLLAYLPEEIQDYIASFIAFRTATYETERFFENRIRYRVIDNALHKNALLVLDKNGNLLLHKNCNSIVVIHKKNKSSASKMFYKEKSTLSISQFAVSCDGTRVAAVVNNAYIAVYDVAKNNAKLLFNFYLHGYYNTDGLAGMANEQLLIEYYRRGYIHTRHKIESPQPIKWDVDHISYESFWFRPITTLAITHEGVVFFANDGDVFTLEKIQNDWGYKKIYTSPLKYIGPFTHMQSNNHIYFTFPSNINQIIFNRQENAVAIVDHPLKPVLLDQQPQNIIKDNNQFYIQLIKRYVDYYYNDQDWKEAVIKSEKADLHGFLEDIKNIQQWGDALHHFFSDLVFMGHNIKNNAQIMHHKVPFKLIQFKDDKNTLAHYLKKRGVCKDLKNSKQYTA